MLPPCATSASTPATRRSSARSGAPCSGASRPTPARATARRPTSCCENPARRRPDDLGQRRARAQVRQGAHPPRRHLRAGSGVEEVLALGATVLHEPGEQRWWVLADPEGHEFCAFPPETDATNDEDAEVAAVRLDLAQDPVALTAALVDVPERVGHRGAAGRPGRRRRWGRSPRLQVVRDGNIVVARTALGRERRVLLAGHLDTVPIADNVPSRLDGDRLFGCGTSDMKSGDAVLLHLAATLAEPAYDLTFVLYDNEEVEADKNGLNRLVAHPARPARGRPRGADGADERRGRGGLPGDAARPGPRSPAAGRTARAAGSARTPSTPRRRCSPRSWRYDARSVDIDGCTYREGLNAVASRVASPATSSPTRARWSSTSASRPTAPRRRRSTTCARCSRRTTSSWSTPPPAPCPGCPPRPRRTSSPPSAARRSRSTAGPTSPASPPSASRR